MPLFCLTGGGTLGHVIPNLMLAEELSQDPESRILYVGSRDGVERAFVGNMLHIEYCHVVSAKLRRYISWRNLLMPARLLAGVVESLVLLVRRRPKVVFSSGGYVGLPVVIAACCLRIPVVTYDADMSMGLANRVASFFASHILCNFESLYNELLELTKGNSHWKYRKVVHVGPFVRREFANVDPVSVREKLGLSGEKPILLIFGGSQGSNFINEVAIKARDKLLWRFDVVHVFGRGKMGEEGSRSGYVAIEFVEKDFASYMAMADVIVSRAGASSIFEMLYLKKPHVLIPMSTRNSRGDQEQNAAYFKERGLSAVVREDDCTPDALYEAVNGALGGREEFLRAVNDINMPDAATTVKFILEDVANSGSSSKR